MSISASAPEPSRPYKPPLRSLEVASRILSGDLHHVDRLLDIPAQLCSTQIRQRLGQENLRRLYLRGGEFYLAVYVALQPVNDLLGLYLRPYLILSAWP